MTMKLNTIQKSKSETLHLITAVTVLLLVLSTPTINGMAISSDTEVIVIYDGTIITWHEEFDAVTLNGDHMTGSLYDSVDKCKATCIEDLQCVGIEFNYCTTNPDYGCWTHKSADYVDILYDGGECADHYAITRTGIATSVEPATSEESTTSGMMPTTTMSPVSVTGSETSDTMSNENPPDIVMTTTMNGVPRDVSSETSMPPGQESTTGGSEMTKSMASEDMESGASAMMTSGAPDATMTTSENAGQHGGNDDTAMSSGQESSTPGADMTTSMVPENMGTGTGIASGTMEGGTSAMMESGTNGMMTSGATGDAMTTSANAGQHGGNDGTGVTAVPSDQESGASGMMPTTTISPVSVSGSDTSDMMSNENPSAISMTTSMNGVPLDISAETTMPAGQESTTAGSVMSTSMATENMESGASMASGNMESSTSVMMEIGTNDMMTSSATDATMTISANAGQHGVNGDTDAVTMTDASMPSSMADTSLPSSMIDTTMQPSMNGTGMPPNMNGTGMPPNMNDTTMAPSMVPINLMNGTAGMTFDDNGTDFMTTTLQNSGRSNSRLDLLSIAVAMVTAWIALVEKQH